MEKKRKTEKWEKSKVHSCRMSTKELLHLYKHTVPNVF